MGQRKRLNVQAAGGPIEHGGVVELLARLAVVEPAELRAFLLARWQDGDATIAQMRIKELQNRYVNAAARARREGAERPLAGVRALVDELLKQRPRMSKNEAFEWVAHDLHRKKDTVRNAYYLQPKHDAVITESLA